MRILAWVHLYPPDHCAGAEMMLHEILLKLTARGHDCQVICDKTSTDTWEGIRLHGSPDNVRELIAEADVVITHLDRTRAVLRTVNGSKPVVHLLHNDKQLRFHRVRPREADLVVANSVWLQRAIRWPGPSIVVPPPVDPARYKTTPGDAITLINLHDNKGPRTFWQLARIFPERPFLAVRGGYGVQEVPERIPPNVTLIDHTSDIVSVYRRTRLLLMPSAYESWGRVGIEAAASGIPTIAHPTPGLKESLGASGTFVERDDIAGYVEAIRAFDDPSLYQAKSRAAVARSAELEPTASIDLLEAALLKLVP